MRLIDADKLTEAIDAAVQEKKEDVTALLLASFAKSCVMFCNTVDAVPVVRCRDCKWYKEGKLLGPTKFCFRLRDADGERIGYNFASDDFCSHGERKGGEEDAAD